MGHEALPDLIGALELETARWGAARDDHDARLRLMKMLRLIEAASRELDPEAPNADLLALHLITADLRLRDAITVSVELIGDPEDKPDYEERAARVSGAATSTLVAVMALTGLFRMLEATPLGTTH
jgi:hypothetical protein